jgi:DNA-binding response OmpR family regulator
MSKKIYIADDDEGIVDALKIMLEMSGYEVTCTTDGNEVFKTNEKPDLFLLDIWMAGVDGREVCRYLKQKDITKDIPVIMISASHEIKDQALQSGANDFIAKPFDMDHLLMKIEEFTT